jgi:hypothetical protein
MAKLPFGHLRWYLMFGRLVLQNLDEFVGGVGPFEGLGKAMSWPLEPDNRESLQSPISSKRGISHLPLLLYLWVDEGQEASVLFGVRRRQRGVGARIYQLGLSPDAPGSLKSLLRQLLVGDKLYATFYPGKRT